MNEPGSDMDIKERLVKQEDYIKRGWELIEQMKALLERGRKVLNVRRD